MSFVSYAQNYEDVILMRALRGVADGFYIDVGAQHPRNDSVTKAFYDLGWHGINIEPVAHWHRMLVEQRPRDINLCVAAGAAEGMIDLFEVQDSGLSTTSAEFARRHRDAGLPVQPPRRVPVRRLDTICVEQGVSQVHFLKVDAEGAEADVLGGIDWRAICPWVVLVEATEPNSRTSNHAKWESLLTGHDYDFVYQDGLNRFYLAREHADLAPAFAAPPNVFDAFVRRDQVDEAARLLEHLRESDALLKNRAGHIEELAGRIGERDAQIALLLEAHRRDVGQIEALHDDLARMAEMHRQSSEAMHAEIEARVRANARLSRELMASQAAQLAAEAARMATHAVRLAAEAETVQVRHALVAERQEYARVMASRSWRLTAPLRVVVTAAREAIDALESGSRGLARLRPVRTLVAAVLSPFPGLARRAKRRLYGEPTPLPVATEDAEPAPLPLTEDAEEILARSPVPPVAGPRR